MLHQLASSCIILHLFAPLLSQRIHPFRLPLVHSERPQIPYERGLVLQITLLPPELRAKGMRFESKGRRLGYVQVAGSCGILDPITS